MNLEYCYINLNLKMHKKRVLPEQIKEVKDMGSKAFGRKDIPGAIAYYRQGLRLAEQYWTENENALPFKMEFGE